MDTQDNIKLPDHHSQKNQLPFSPETLKDIAKIRSVIGNIDISLLSSNLEKILAFSSRLNFNNVTDDKLVAYILDGTNNFKISIDELSYLLHYRKLINLGLTYNRLSEIASQALNFQRELYPNNMKEIIILAGIHDDMGKEYLTLLIKDNDISDTELEAIKAKSSIDLT